MFDYKNKLKGNEMTNEQVKDFVTNNFPTAVFDETGEWLNIQIDAKEWHSLAEQLRNDMYFNYLFCLTCIDWKTHLTMVYHLSGTSHRRSIVIKAKLDRENPEIETVSDLWRTARLPPNL